MQKLIKGPIDGYKAMNDDMTCRGFKFAIGKTYELDNDRDLVLCGNGFHFCPQPSGVWAYYSSGRLFKVRAYDVLDTPVEAGADFKRVCRKIEIVEEVKIDGDRNTGNRNTGNCNTGDYNTGNCNTGYRNTGDRNTGGHNTGYRNTGYYNTGYCNTGDYNTGYCNTGNYNTGYCNTGDYNTGYYNTGNRNTGYCNTGNYNTGNYNTGDRNTGYGNCTEYSSGHFNSKEPPLIIFDKPAKRDGLDMPLVRELAYALSKDDPLDVDKYLSIPNATKAKIKALHQKHIDARRTK